MASWPATTTYAPPRGTWFSFVDPLNWVVDCAKPLDPQS
jgi:hypothetical protein